MNMDNREKRSRLLDSLTVYGISLVLSVLCTLLLYRVIGIYAYYLSYVLTSAVVIIISRRTGIKAASLLAFNKPRIGQTVGSAFILAGALLASLPFILFMQIILPDFSQTVFLFSEALGGSSLKYLHITLIILMSAFSECLLFDGYIFSHAKKIMRLLFAALMIGGAFALFRHDLYLLMPLFICGTAVIYVRGRTSGMTLPLIMHILINTVMISFVDAAAADSESLFGIKLGVLNVLGMAMILIGAALPVTVIGMRIMGDFKKRPVFEKAAVLFVALLLIASGYAVSRLG